MKKPFEMFTKKDFEILTIMWKEDRPMSSSEIVKCGTGLNQNTVQAELRKLLKNDVVCIAEIGYSNTVLCRKYVPKLSEQDFLAQNYAREYRSSTDNKNISLLMSAFLDMESDAKKRDAEIEKLTEMLKEYKECPDR